MPSRAPSRLAIGSSSCASACLLQVVLAACSCFCHTARAIDNGIGVRPPRGWRSWNNFGTGIHQGLIEAQYASLAKRSRQVDGALTSLLDLGYNSAGIDDGWQKCNSGPSGHEHETAARPCAVLRNTPLSRRRGRRAADSTAAARAFFFK